MLTLPDPKHEAFATLRASGHDVAAAYIHAGYSVKNVKTRARKLVRNPAIQARIEYLKTCLPRIAELHQHHCPTLLLMPETRHEMLVWLWQVMNGTRLIKSAQMRAATLYCRLQGWHLAKLLPQAQAGCPTPDAADKPPVPSSTLTESEKTFLASSNRENIAHERTLMPRSPESLARYQSILANLAHPACRQDAFGRPVPDLISKATPATPPAPASPVSPVSSINSPCHQSHASSSSQNPRPVNPANPVILSKNSQPESPQTTPSVRPVSPVRPVLSPPPITIPTAQDRETANPPILSKNSQPEAPQTIAPSPSQNPRPVNPANPVILSKNPQPVPHPKPLTLNRIPSNPPQPRTFLNTIPTRLNLPPRKTPRPLAAAH